MEKSHVSTVVVVFLLGVSFVGLALIPILLLQPNLKHVQFSIQNELVGILYSVICLLGVAAVFYPTKCRGMFQKMQNPLHQTNTSSDGAQIKGHHPNCQNYSANRIKVGERVFCAACAGLLVGAIIALIGVFFYFFVGSNFSFDSIWLVALGEVGMFLGLVQIKFAGFVKVVVNIVFVVASFVTLVGVDMLGRNMFLDLYVLGLTGFLLLLRILLSEWNNNRTCQACQRCFQ